jgi:hypothetical protein
MIAFPKRLTRYFLPLMGSSNGVFRHYCNSQENGYVRALNCFVVLSARNNCRRGTRDRNPRIWKNS